jgi:SAM-dependent methyltransferase
MNPVPMESVEACPVCRGSEYSNHFHTKEWIHGLPGDFRLIECKGCGLGYLKERPVEEHISFYYPKDAYYSFSKASPHSLFSRRDAIASVWYFLKKSVLAYRYNYRHLGGGRRTALVTRIPGLRFLDNYASCGLDVLLHPYVENGSLLEVGCGSGRYLDLMRALGWKRVVGVDLSPDAAAAARDTLGLEVYCGNVSEVGLEPNSFDAASLEHTLEHVYHPVEFLRSIWSVLKPGARLAVHVPNFESYLFRVYGPYWPPLEAPRHIVHFTGRSLTLALETAGFRVDGLTTNPRGAYRVALFGKSRQAGDDNATYTDAEAHFPLARRARALGLSLAERGQCALGLPAGEELAALAVKPAHA